ncbi:hypothetical protein [Marinobacter alexandrii]|uniref:hypothetical protein n=1 Tax=Marinobacter alexandrii TaxID=2570351 RepID=UPI0011086830|nr:hypothetical protein [Marinobacter alexandrii]
MFKKTLISVAVASSLGLTGCFDSGDSGANANPDYKISNPAIDGKTWPVFNPVTSQLPIPNDLIFDSEAGDGTFAVADTAPPVTTALNSLSGASTVAPIDIAFSADIDASSVDGQPFLVDVDGELQLNSGVAVPNPSQNVFLIELDYASGDPLRGLTGKEPPTIPAAVPFGTIAATLAAGGTPSAGLVTSANEAARAAVDQYEVSVVEQSGSSVIRINLLTPLDPQKRYVVVVTDSVVDAKGEAIIASPSYGSLSDEEQPLGTSSLQPVKDLINGLWEPIASNYFSLTNSTRAGMGMSPISDENIAISYSFTTSADEKVVGYIADPDDWFTDQITGFVRSSASASVVEGGLDVDGDGDTSPDYDDVKMAADGAVAFFPLNPSDPTDTSTRDALVTAGIEAAFGSGAFSTESGTNCNTLDPDSGTYGAANEGATYIDCIGEVLTGLPSPNGFADLLPTPADQSASVLLDYANTNRAALQSAAVATVTGASDAFVVQGSIELPYYLGIPTAANGSTINSSTWNADNTLAAAINDKFSGLGLTLPQGEATVSDTVNYIYPFPEKTGTENLQTPLLVMYPSSAEPLDGFPVVVFQHGITTDRSAALSVGSVLTASGFAVVAIDLPLHGVDAQDQSDLTSGVTEEKQGLASALLAGFDAAAGTTENTADNIASLLAGTYPDEVQAELVSQGCPDNRDMILSGLCGADAAQFMGFAIGAQSSVNDHTSVIPGIARTNYERHFDFTADASLAPTAMNFDSGFGSSGSLFINLQGFINSRDKNRQGAVDLLNLIQSLGGIDVDNDGNSDFDTDRVFLAGHSLGTVIGTGAVAAANQSDVVTDVVATALYAPASGIVRMLENSPSFAPRIIGGLAAVGVEQGTSNYESFLRVFQHAIDAADPVNLADNLVAAGNGVINFNVVGTANTNGDTVYKSDQTNVIEAGNVQLTSQFGVKPFQDYLAGAIPFSEELGATNVVANTGTEVFLASNLAYGNHGMFVLPSEDQTITDDAARAADLQRQKDAFAESLAQTAEFFLGNGTLSGGAVNKDTGRIGAPATQPILDDRETPTPQDVIDSDDTDEFKQLN